MISLLLTEDETHISVRVFEQYLLQYLKTDDELIVLLYCEKDDFVEARQVYEDFKREDGQDIPNCISMFDLKYKQMERNHVKLTSEVLSFRLLKRQN